MPQICTYPGLTEEELTRLGHILAPLLKAGDLIGLQGNLGAGKSVFARSVIRTLLGDENLDVPSPTYTLVHPYQSPGPDILHIDLYRVESKNEIQELGLDDAGDAILLVEWPERLGTPFPEHILLVKIEKTDRPGDRTVTLSGDDVWKNRLRKQTLIRQ